MRHFSYLAFTLFLAACGGNQAAKDPASSATQATTVKAPGDAKVGDTTTCPVSGESFVVTESSPKVEYEGKTYYTCCAGCKAKLAADPKKYLSAPAK